MQASKPLFALLATAGALLISACSKPASEESVSTTVAEVPAVPVAMPRTASPEGASVFFISPGDGETVSNPVSVEFGIAQMSVVKAGEMAANAGHHHLLIDTELPDPGMPVPSDEHHRHFGDASTATELTLGSGQHTLQLLFADHLHIPHDPVVASETITITVK